MKRKPEQLNIVDVTAIEEASQQIATLKASVTTLKSIRKFIDVRLHGKRPRKGVKKNGEVYIARTR